MSDKGLVFISYKREDEPFARQLREQLHDWGCQTWMDIFDIPKGAYWPDEIQKGLEAADFVVGVLSPNSVQSRNVKNEWDWAIVYNKRLILLMTETCIVPMNYISLNWIEYHKAPDAAYIQLKAALEVGKPIIGSGNATLAPITSQTTGTVTTPDPYQDYLQKLYERLNKALAQRVIKRKDENAREAEPLHLRSSSAPEAVDALFAKQDEIDPLFEAMGITMDAPKQDYDDFAGVFNYYEGQVLLLGEPGAGKTITLLQFARDAVVRRIQDPAQKLPMFAILPEWLQKGMPNISEWMAQTYGAAPDAAKLVRSGKALLLLDGLDELSEERPVDLRKPEGEKFDPRVHFMKMLEVISSLDNHIVVTCRIADYEQIGIKISLKGAVTLKKLDEAQITAYLEDVPGLADVFKDDVEMQEIAETPLLLSLIAYAFRDKPKELEGLRDIEEGVLRDVIFNAYIQERFAHETRKLKARGLKPPFELDILVHDLGWIAMTDAVEKADNVLNKRDFWRTVGSSKSQTFIRFCQQLNLIVESDAETWRFIHLKLRDALAYGLAEKLINVHVKSIKLRSIEAIAEIRDTQALPILLYCALHDSDKEIYTRVIEVIGEIGELGLNELAELLNDFDEYVCKRTFDVINELGLPILPVLEKTIKHPIVNIRIESISRLQDISDLKVVPALIEALRDPIEEVVQKAIMALGNAKQKNVLPILINLLQHTNSVIRISAIDALGDICDSPIPELKMALTDSDINVSISASRALQKIQNKQRVNVYAPSFVRYHVFRDISDFPRSDSFDQVMRKALEEVDNLVVVIAGRGDYEKRSKLYSMSVYNLLEVIQTNKNSNNELVQNAFLALEDNGLPALSALIALASDPIVNQAATDSIGALYDADCIPQLELLLKNHLIRAHALEALRNIGNEDALRITDAWEHNEKTN